MTHPSPYLMNAWYVAATADEIGTDGMLHRKILGTSVVLYRSEDGSPVALHDRCPHRFAPLSMGRREGDALVCPYHGLKFNSAGACVHNPHGKGVVTKALAVRSFPVVEKHGFVWIWMAEEAADHALLPDYSPLDEGHENGVARTYMKLPVNYRLILDNVMDLSHVDHVHGEIISTRGQLSPLFPDVQETESTVSAAWEWQQTPPMLILNQFLPRPEEEARHWIQVNWSAPGNIQLSLYCAQDDTPVKEGPGQYDLHSVTPEDEFSTHYFFATRRNHIEDDAEYNAMKIRAMHDAFENEDGPVIAACQREMGERDFFAMNPVLMSNDLAAVKMRRRLQGLIEAENSAAITLEAAE
ncbi:aromatic ring-hydroxylating dioxygenase subunit alpha [Novosphingobium naphthalenivorans]|uniref:aromatic ring-hydroxylating dioxygenase subunit alpha n=1 Tax=Novosphingobium naphthalenivorans TaxID=273168 RepID=UPI0008325394|nr:aromatic ring-hydroxylating dioxygenase subunit alpha [Novosphingobium naphthalenivorans]